MQVNKRPENLSSAEATTTVYYTSIVKPTAIGSQKKRRLQLVLVNSHSLSQHCLQTITSPSLPYFHVHIPILLPISLPSSPSRQYQYRHFWNTVAGGQQLGILYGAARIQTQTLTTLANNRITYLSKPYKYRAPLFISLHVHHQHHVQNAQKAVLFLSEANLFVPLPAPKPSLCTHSKIPLRGCVHEVEERLVL